MLSLVFDTRASKVVYVDPPISFLRKCVGVVIVVLGVLLSVLISGGVIILAGSVGNLLGELINPNLGIVLAGALILVAVYYSFIASVIFIASVAFFLRKKVYKTLGYFKNEYFEKTDNRLLECFDLDAKLIQAINIDEYSILVSRRVGEGMELFLQSKSGDTINLADIFNSPFRLFHPRSTRPGFRPNDDKSSSIRTYPADEMFADFNKTTLIKDGVEMKEIASFPF